MLRKYMLCTIHRVLLLFIFFFSSRRRHTRSKRDWSSACALPIYRELLTTELGVTSFEVTPRDPVLSWTIQAKDEQGRTGSRHVIVTCGDFVDDFLVQIGRASCRERVLI